jgi:hypothetical protein
MSDEITQRILQLEADLALAQHNIKQLIQWVEARIFADDTVDKRKSEADRQFIRNKYYV